MALKKRFFVQSLNDAADGIIFVVKNERNMRVHYFFGIFVLLLGIFLGISRVEWIVLCGVTSLVWVAELFNTAIEHSMNLVEKKMHASVRTIKHIAAGAVLVSALNAVITGFFIFSKYWALPAERVLSALRYSSVQVTFVALLAVVLVVVGGKAFFRHGSPFRGGAVSGHAAIAFALWTALIHSETNLFVIGAAFLMAALVAQSRLKAKIHSVWEVTAGSLIGYLVMTLFFRLFLG